ncbi:MAG: nicotinate phosphoribosyltransferase [Myxococcales bacterium]|nr:nicotinate phosphoribosyltransferase [Myxococcales bacterium]
MDDRSSLALLTDLYQLTMAAGYHRAGIAERRACFHLTFRRAPFKGGYAIAAGLADAIDYLSRLRFSEVELGYLRSLTNADGSPLFAEDFLQMLGQSELRLDVDAVPEGTVVFAHEPLVRVEGPLWQAQLVETALLTVVNFQTLVATKASRVCSVARGPSGKPEPVLEFGLRRAQGIDGGLAASRAAYVGGCAGTSNVLAGLRFGIPVRGTHAHSWVMTFPTERQAFDAYAQTFPKGCIFLVDTYDTLAGVRNAVAVGKELRAAGHELVGVRLDSGDLAKLSVGARRILDEGGFPDARIVASNDLDEYAIAELKAAGARIDTWGVGTKLVTAFDQPALGGVYKLAALENENGVLEPRIKLSEEPIKTSIPAAQQVRRFSDSDGRFVADAIFDVETGLGDLSLIDPSDPTRMWRVPEGLTHEDLLVPIVRGGEVVYEQPSIGASRDRARAQLARLPEGVRKLRDPEPYFAGLEPDLHHLREKLRAAHAVDG